MKTALMTLSALGLVFALAGPSFAVSPDRLSLVNKGPAAVVRQAHPCEEGQKWDDAVQKCVEDKG